MSESATGLRERRMADTAGRMKSVARRMTAESGFAGFTIDELCDEVGVSRRTFFNYFASKENAVLGLPAGIDGSDLNEEFVLAFVPRHGRLSATLVDDLTTLSIKRWERFEISPTDFREVHAAISREPRLVAHLLQLATEGERDDIALVERREGLEAGDIRAIVAVQLFGSLHRSSMQEYLSTADPEPFATVFLRHLAAAREVIAL